MGLWIYVDDRDTLWKRAMSAEAQVRMPMAISFGATDVARWSIRTATVGQLPRAKKI